MVKAGGYGHGSVEVARAALDGGASWLAVALVEEGVELRGAGIDAPILLLSEPTPAAMSEVVRAALTPTVDTPSGLRALVEAVRGAQETGPFSVHVKVDTGMHRVGASPDDAVALAVAVDRHPDLMLEGLWTHLAVADEVDNAYTGEQLARFDGVLADLARAGVHPPIRHAANSGAAMWHPGEPLRPGPLWHRPVRIGPRGRWRRSAAGAAFAPGSGPQGSGVACQGAASW